MEKSEPLGPLQAGLLDPEGVCNEQFLSGVLQLAATITRPFGVFINWQRNLGKTEWSPR